MKETGSSVGPLKVESWGRTLAKVATPKIFQAGGKKDINPRLSKPSQDFLGTFSEIQSCHHVLFLPGTNAHTAKQLKQLYVIHTTCIVFIVQQKSFEKIVGFEKQENI